jgi:pSer/pThr/pTyr-binding forkhead associated (FHA) protein
MQSILIRYLSGERSNQVDTFSADSHEEIIAGRDPLAKIHFDAREADLVSRQHAKIVKDPEDPAAFRLIDLQSRNGTFVNQRRVYGSTFLSHNDRVQLGPSGPEFSFELDPPPLSTNGDVSPTVATELSIIPPTREIFPYSGTREVGLGRPIGRATVERMLDDTFGLLKEESNKAFTIGLICLIAVLLVGLGTWMYMRRSSVDLQAAQQQNQAAMNAVLRQTEKQTAAARQLNGQVAGLADDVQRSDQKNQSRFNSLARGMSALKKSQEAAIAAERRQQVSSPSPVQATSADTPTFGELQDRVASLVKQSKYAEALEPSRNLIRMDPSRYERYFYAGVSALEQQQARIATEYLQQAIIKAPSDQRAPIEKLLALANAQQIAAKEK